MPPTPTPTKDIVLVLAASLLVACGGEEDAGSASRRAAPTAKQCALAELGEAADRVAAGDLPSRQYAKLTGLTDPRTLVWQDERTKDVFYITRVMGTERRLYYMEQLETGEEPVPKSTLVGTITRWSELPPERGVVLARALKREYDLEIEPERTWLMEGEIGRAHV